MKAAALCDGLRCDMAMLVLPEIFERTWGLTTQPFWPDAIARVKQSHPDFTLLAEVYWDLEAGLLQQGFDYAYDKRLYDSLRSQDAGPVHKNLAAEPAYQARLARFLENHDEPRAAKTFAPGPHQAAALIAFFAPGLRFFQHGQLEGSQLRLPVQLCRVAGRAGGPLVAELLPAIVGCIAGRTATARLVAAARAHPCLGEQLELGKYHWVSLAKRPGQALAGGDQFFTAPEPGFSEFPPPRGGRTGRPPARLVQPGSLRPRWR